VVKEFNRQRITIQHLQELLRYVEMAPIVLVEVDVERVRIMGALLVGYNLSDDKKLQPLTPGKPQPHTQAFTPSFRPRPTYPLGNMVRKDEIALRLIAGN